jgi:alpha-N-arabinofuranosidase
VVEAVSLFDDDIHAANTLASPDRVSLREVSTPPIVDGVLTIELPPVSWMALRLE